MTALDAVVRGVSLVILGWGLCLLTQPGCGTVKISEKCPAAVKPEPVIAATKCKEPENDGIDLDFIEIGTSNFETLIQKATDKSKGLSVEALKMYQEQLPDKPGVTKVNAAISDPKPGETSAKFYYIHPDDIKKHRLPPWLIGCNAVNKPQTEADRILKNRNLTHLMKFDEVPVISFSQLVEKYNIKSIGYLKLDVEGHEPVIINSMVEACKAKPNLWPRAITFEHKHIKKFEKQIVKTLDENGYYIAAYTTGDHRDYTMARIE